MALTRLDVPAVMLYGGSIAPGRWRGRDVTIQDVFEAIGAHAAGDLSDEELHGARGVREPRRRGLRRSVHRQHDGLRVRGDGHLADGLGDGAGDGRRKGRDRPRRPGGSRSRRSADDLRPSKVITRDSLENAIACVCASGGSTNGVLHLLAVAREAGIELEIDDFEHISRRTPLLADLKPGGNFVATDLYKAGGVGVIAKRLAEAGVLHGDALTVTGRTVGEEAERERGDPGTGGGPAARPSR